jgi:hypothetical protein
MSVFGSILTSRGVWGVGGIGMQQVRRKGKRSLISVQLIIVFMIILSIVLFYYNFLWSTDGYQAKESVVEFYQLEQNGNFGSAWELLHSSMHEKFTKEAYIQKRAQVFMQQLGASTFEFEVSKSKNVGTWGMSATSPALSDVQRVHVTQHMLTVFGELELNQDIFVAEENNGWRLLWSYYEQKS